MARIIEAPLSVRAEFKARGGVTNVVERFLERGRRRSK
jgi:hypothetical protein